MIWCFASLPALFKSYQDKERVIMKDSVQRSPYSHELNSVASRMRTQDNMNQVSRVNRKARCVTVQMYLTNALLKYGHNTDYQDGLFIEITDYQLKKE